MVKESPPFWVFSYAKGAGSAAGEARRWGLDSSLDGPLTDRLKRQEGPVSVPIAPLIAEAERLTDPDDVPWVNQDFYVVSDRTRAIFEEAGPSDCQFIPIDIRFQGKSIGATYWVLHVLRTIDCADHKTSYNVNKYPQPPFYMRSTIIADKVPPEVSIFRIRFGSSYGIVRDSLRRKLVRAKIKGCAFYLP